MPASEENRKRVLCLFSLGQGQVVGGTGGDFRFPDTSGIVFSGDKTEALTGAAKTLVTTCATDRFAVSFVVEMPFQLPVGRCRMYKQNVPAAQVEQIAQESGLETPLTHLVFLTDVHDTRFDAYSVLRPLP